MKHNSSEHNDLIEWALKELDSLNEEIGFELDLSELDEEIFWQITDDAYESYVGVYDPERGKFNNFQEPEGLYFECFLKGLCATEVFQEALIHHLEKKIVNKKKEFLDFAEKRKLEDLKGLRKLYKNNRLNAAEYIDILKRMSNRKGFPAYFK